MILEIPHSPVFLDRSEMQVLNESERRSELLQRMEDNNEHETMMDEVLQPCRASNRDILGLFGLGRTTAEGSGFLQEQFLLLFLVAV